MSEFFVGTMVLLLLVITHRTSIVVDDADHCGEDYYI